MRVLILGGGGAIGQATARAFAARGDEAVWASRQAAPASPAWAPGHIRADRARPDEITRIVRDHGVDTVVDMVAYALADAQPLLDALQGQVGRYVLISSCDVYRNYGLLHRTETGAPDLGPLDEDAPLRARPFPYRGDRPRAADDPDRWMDDYDKIPIEGAVRAMTCDWTILRLPMVYGPGDRQRRFWWAVRPMQSSVPVLEAPRAWLTWTTAYGFVDNVGAAIAHAAAHAKAARAVFNVADETPMDHWAWAERFRGATRWAGEVRATDDDTPFAQAVAGMDLSVPLKISPSRLFDELGFRPPYDLDVAARVTALDEGGR